MKKDKTIKSVVSHDLCAGCGTCVALCPTNAIEMMVDGSKGTYLPRIDWEKCNQCGICLRVCPGHVVDFPGLNLSVFSARQADSVLGYYLSCFTGYAADRDLRYSCSSGGLVTAMLISALETGLIDGALVTRMKDSNPLEPEPFLARSKGEIISAARSKYCPVPANTALNEVLKGEGKYAVVGLSCHIHGIRKAEEVNKELKRKIALHMGIFCRHSPSFLATRFLLRQRGVSAEDVLRIDYRGDGWPGGMTVQLRGGKKVFISHFEAWKTLDFAFAPRRCLLCCDGANELADISFGDAWLDEFSEDKLGTSIVIARTREGENILRSMAAKGVIELRDTTAAKVAASQQDFRSKKVSPRLYRIFARLMFQRLPVYNTKMGKVGLNDTINASLRWLGLFLSSHRRLWGLIPLLTDRLIPFLGAVQRFLRLKPAAPAHR